LLSGDHFYGVMEFARRRTPVGFTQRDLTIADGIARQTAVALQRGQLIEESRRLVRALESTADAVLITDAQARVIFANKAFMDIFGYRPEEVIGHDALEISGGGPESWLTELRQTVEQRGWRGETVAYRKDGTEFPILLNAGMIRDDDGEVQGAVAILQDISEEKRFQQQMQRADRLAAVGEMAAGIAHEVNNALAVIFGQTEDAAERPNEELRPALQKVDNQGRRIAEIVKGVLGFARPHEPERQPIDLVSVTRQTLDLISHDIDRQGVRLETSFDGDLPSVMADPQQLQQVLLNLLGNALQAMGSTEDPSLRVEVCGIDDRLAIRVRDTGPGISPDVVARIFDPFFSTKDDGSGLGLSVSYAIAQAHGGELQVESRLGAGATFTLVLPISRPGAGEVPAAEGFERVLLVDDDPDVAEALTTMLTKEGIAVSHVGSGPEALTLLDSDSAWDALFLDVRLPGMSGPEIYAKLAEKLPELAQSVVFVTGGLWRTGSRLRKELPPQPILPKPCTQDQVRDVLRRLRSQRRAAA
jgi:two-component system NtrC family sensor kinase